MHVNQANNGGHTSWLLPTIRGTPGETRRRWSWKTGTFAETHRRRLLCAHHESRFLVLEFGVVFHHFEKQPIPSHEVHAPLSSPSNTQACPPQGSVGHCALCPQAPIEARRRARNCPRGAVRAGLGGAPSRRGFTSGREMTLRTTLVKGTSVPHAAQRERCTARTIHFPS